MPTRRLRLAQQPQRWLARLAVVRQRQRLKRAGIETLRLDQQVVRDDDGDGPRLTGHGQLKRLPNRCGNVGHAVAR